MCTMSVLGRNRRGFMTRSEQTCADGDEKGEDECSINATAGAT